MAEDATVTVDHVSVQPALFCHSPCAAFRFESTFVRSQELLAVSERFDVGEVLNDVARLTAPRWRDAPQAEGRPIQLDVAAESGCWINGSPAALREAITNLIFNAVDALPHGGAIHLEAHEHDDRIVIEVRDTGTGMPPEVQAHLCRWLA